MESIHIIEEDKFVAKIIEQNIYYIRYFDKISLTLEDMKLSFDAFNILSKGKKVKVLIEFGILSTIDDEAREYAERNKIPALAEALIMTTIASRVLAIMYFRFRVQKHPVKIHSTFKKGIEWLKSIN